jgi:hypothetical protein
MKRAVMCILPSVQHAETAVVQLKQAGFSTDDVSVLFPNREGTKDFAHEHNTKAPEGAIAGVGAGGVLGAGLGVLAGLGLLAIPGLGPFIAAGPLMAALSGAAAGATVGGVAGALVGMGIPEIEAKRYEGKIRDGNILMSVHTENRAEASAVEGVFKSLGATDISTASEPAAPKTAASSY